jgi:hypothetical protein
MLCAQSGLQSEGRPAQKARTTTLLSWELRCGRSGCRLELAPQTDTLGSGVRGTTPREQRESH